MMRSIMMLSVSVLTFGLVASAQAETIKVDCDFAAYQRLNRALDIAEVRVGAAYKEELKGILGQEMGPVCKVLIDMEPKFGIPGNKYFDYEVTANGVKIDVAIVESLEMNNTIISISK